MSKSDWGPELKKRSNVLNLDSKGSMKWLLAHPRYMSGSVFNAQSLRPKSDWEGLMWSSIWRIKSGLDTTTKTLGKTSLQLKDLMTKIKQINKQLFVPWSFGLPTKACLHSNFRITIIIHVLLSKIWKDASMVPPALPET